MNPVREIESTLQRAARRRRWCRGWIGFWLGLLVAAAAWLLVLAVYKLLPLSFDVVLGVGAVCATGPLWGFLIGWRRPTSLWETARWLDQKQRLQERLSTAWELSSQRSSEEWRQLLIGDAASHLRGVRLSELLPIQLPKAARWAALVLLVAAVVGFAPEYRSQKHLQQQRETDNIRNTGKQMAELVRRQFEQRPPALETTQEGMKAAMELGDHLGKAKVSRDEALRNLASLAEKLKQENQELLSNPALKRLEQAARTPAGQTAGSPASLQKQIDSLQKALGEKAADRDALNEIKKEMENLQQAAKGLADKEGGAAEAARQQLGQAASELAKKAAAMGLPLGSLNEAIAALAAQQIDQFVRDLNFAATELEELQKMAEALQQLQQQAEKMGKDLPEQLNNGQAQAAQATLQKMIDQLKSPNLSNADLQKIMDEVARAVEPGTQYGKVGEHLQAAVGKMNLGQQSAATESLAAAAKELERLLEEMGDADSLMATLDALKRSQMCIGNCSGWGLCQSPGGAGPKGGRGGGVGTWADDSQWLDEQDGQMWDNSGIVRPDQDSRGITEREQDLSSGLNPTKVTGKMAPGGPMPSVTLRGVSIKGQSTVSLESAVVAAQQEAQSALSQDQVPRAYQGAVRDYFDDLKK